eukprot:c21900_g1_i2 orf=93-398(-)
MDSSPEHVSGNAESDSAADSGSDSGQHQSTADQAQQDNKQEEKDSKDTKVDSAVKDKLNAQTSSSGLVVGLACLRSSFSLPLALDFETSVGQYLLGKLSVS